MEAPLMSPSRVVSFSFEGDLPLDCAKKQKEVKLPISLEKDKIRDIDWYFEKLENLH